MSRDRQVFAIYYSGCQNKRSNTFLHPFVGTMIIFELIDCGSAKSLASRRTGLTSKEYVVAIRKPMIRVLYMRPRLIPDGWLVVVEASVVLVEGLVDFSSSAVSITLKSTMQYYLTIEPLTFCEGLGIPEEVFRATAYSDNLLRSRITWNLTCNKVYCSLAVRIMMSTLSLMFKYNLIQ